MRKARIGGAATVFGLAVLGAGGRSYAGSEIFVEGVSWYDVSPHGGSGCHGGDIQHATSDASGFLLFASAYNPAGYTARTPYWNNKVWTSDFMDPEKTGLSGDTDWIWFDKRGNAFSYLSAHGQATWNGDTENRSYAQLCYNDIACSPGGMYSVPSAIVAMGGGYPGHCHRYPGDNFGHCSYTVPDSRQIILDNCVDGPPGRNGSIHYGIPGNVKWGESNHATWSGAGTNGGTNFAVLSISHAELSMRGPEVWEVFGGIHALATTMSHGGDTIVDADRGFYFAMEGVINPYGPVSQAWLAAMDSLAAGTGCYDWYATWSYGGGLGNSGCGGHQVTTIGTNVFEAIAHMNEDWYDVKRELNDATASSGWVIQNWKCNYNCYLWPFSIP